MTNENEPKPEEEPKKEIVPQVMRGAHMSANIPPTADPPTPKPMTIIPPVEKRSQPAHPTGKIPNQLEAMWTNLESFAHEVKNAKGGIDFLINVLSQFGLVEAKQKSKEGQPLWNVAKPLREPWLKINEIKDRVVNIEEELKNMKMDLTMLKQMILELKNERPLKGSQAPLREMLETPEEKELSRKPFTANEVEKKREK